jgi:Ca2+-transporting ATPase
MLGSRNKPLWSITAAAALLLAVVLYVPAVRDVFQFSNLHVNDILVCIGLALLSVTWIEIMKLRHAE